jgi:hypothetical protein
MQKRLWRGSAGIMDATEMVEWLSQIVHKRVTIGVQAADMHSLGFLKNHAFTMQKSCLE